MRLPNPRTAARLAAAAVTLSIGLCTAPVALGSGPGPIGAFTTTGAWTFVSAPRLHPPKLQTHGAIAYRKLAPGDFLTANFPNLAATHPAKGAALTMIGQSGPLILDRHLQPVWFAPIATDQVAADLQQESYLGSPVLVWWQGVLTSTGATASGQVVVVDQHYRRVATLKAKRPWVISLHDAVISGSAVWVTVYRNVTHQNLARYGGSRNGTVYDAGAQEYDLKTGKPLFTWDALNPSGAPNVPLSQSQQPPPAGAWDAYHINSVQPLLGNEVLVSMRNTWAAYLLDTTTGRTVWTLGGRNSSFRFGPGAAFQWQHDVQLIGANQVSLFDDACCKMLPRHKFAVPNGPSQGMVLSLDPARHTAKLVARYRHAPPIHAAFLGSMQQLRDGNALVGWGNPSSYFSEYDRRGTQLLDALWPGPDLSYRVRHSDTWVGTPYFPPAGAARTAHGRTTVYASWNGATQVATWQVLAGRVASHLGAVDSARANGFETVLELNSGRYRFFRVRAFDARRKPLGTSATF